MVQRKLNSTIYHIVGRYKALVKQKIPVTEVIVFGSYTKGKAKPYSDIDVAVVSPRFGRDRHRERVLLSRFADTIDLRIEPHPYHPKDLIDHWDGMAREIRTTGVPVI